MRTELPISQSRCRLCPSAGNLPRLAPRAGQIADAFYLRAAQAYMLISMPTGTSTIFGVLQAIQASISAHLRTIVKVRPAGKQCKHSRQYLNRLRKAITAIAAIEPARRGY